MIETVRTWTLLRQLRSSVNLSPTRLRLLQDTLLQTAVIHAYENVPFYRRFWDAQGFDARSVQGIQDLARIPIINSRIVREATERGEFVARNGEAASHNFLYTTGSSGFPLAVCRRAEEVRLWQAGGLRTYFEHGFRWHHKKVQFATQPGVSHFLQRMGISRTTWISPELPTEEQRKIFLETKADWVIATPTVLRRLIKALMATGGRFKQPRAVICQGELLDAETRKTIECVFGSTPVDLYTLTEVGYVAWQCERREGLHVNADTHLVEIVRDGGAARPNQLGKVVVTDLRNRTMPFLRYDTGDLAIAATGPCPCGRPLPRLASIEGRLRTSILLNDGQILTTRAIVDHLAGVLRLNEYRLHQEITGRFRLELSRAATLADETHGHEQTEARSRDVILRHLRKLLGDVEISIETVGPFPECGEKTHPIVANIPLSIS